MPLCGPYTDALQAVSQPIKSAQMVFGVCGASVVRAGGVGLF